jgi:hypothetical protein
VTIVADRCNETKIVATMFVMQLSFLLIVITVLTRPTQSSKGPLLSLELSDDINFVTGTTILSQVPSKNTKHAKNIKDGHENCLFPKHQTPQRSLQRSQQSVALIGLQSGITVGNKNESERSRRTIGMLLEELSSLKNKITGTTEHCTVSSFELGDRNHSCNCFAGQCLHSNCSTSNLTVPHHTSQSRCQTSTVAETVKGQQMPALQHLTTDASKGNRSRNMEPTIASIQQDSQTPNAAEAFNLLSSTERRTCSMRSSHCRIGTLSESPKGANIAPMASSTTVQMGGPLDQLQQAQTNAKKLPAVKSKVARTHPPDWLVAAVANVEEEDDEEGQLIRWSWSRQQVAATCLLEWLFTNAYSLLLSVISLSLVIKSLNTMAQCAVARACTTILEAHECSYLLEQLLYLVHSRLDLPAIIYFHSHWMSFIAYAIAFAGPTAAIAASAITLAGISIDCAAATFQSTEVGSALCLLGYLTRIIWASASHTSSPPAYIPKQHRGWNPVKRHTTSKRPILT